jgi:hypothetical protein
MLSTEDKNALQFARGYYGLEMYAAAEAELKRGSGRSQQHPDYLELWSLLHASRGEWTKSLECAELLIEAEPNHPAGFNLKADAIRRTHPDGALAAYQVLIEVVGQFPWCGYLKYNLCCHLATARRLTLARRWLVRCFRDSIGSNDEGYYQNVAYRDPDLRPLWPELSRINEIAVRLNERNKRKWEECRE